MNTTSGWKVAAVICRRELVRFVRQPARIAAAIGTPLLLWLFLASGFAEALRPEVVGDVTYAAFLLPGAMTLIAVFTAIFSSISIIEDRNTGWLRAALVAPVPRWSIALGKILGGATVAFAQAAILLLLIPAVGVTLGWIEIALVLAALAATSFAMTALGVAFAWKSETTAGFHAVMNLVFMPMWLLSGAFFAVSGAATWLAWLMTINPLTWCTLAIRNPMIGEPAFLPLFIACVFALVMMVIATSVVARPSTIH